MNNTFLCLMDGDGELRPMSFIARDNEAGRISAEIYAKKLESGEMIIKVTIEKTNEVVYQE